MATFVMMGKYVGESVGSISAKRTEKALKLLADNGGKLVAGYATLGEIDILLVCELPGIEEAVKASIALTSALGIAFRTSPAIPVEKFDKLLG